MEISLLWGIVLIAIGGAIGAVGRYLVGEAIDSSHFPWATFAVNTIGSFLLATVAFAWPGIPTEYRLLIFTGPLGAFTTMSTFAFDTVTMLDDDRYGDALMNFGLNAGLCIAGAFAGKFVGGLIAG